MPAWRLLSQSVHGGHVCLGAGVEFSAPTRDAKLSRFMPGRHFEPVGDPQCPKLPQPWIGRSPTWGQQIASDRVFAISSVSAACDSVLDALPSSDQACVELSPFGLRQLEIAFNSLLEAVRLLPVTVCTHHAAVADAQKPRLHRSGHVRPQSTASTSA
ncbi:unnamed protein product [Symbiodinium sp. CCMP2592]|nr:unnamed protein product [Symbiodinium sp. CCMP2592]